MGKVEELPDIDDDDQKESTTLLQSDQDKSHSDGEWDDILGSGRILKKIIEKGTGHRPEVSAGVRIHFKYHPLHSLDVDAVQQMDLEHMEWECDSQAQDTSSFIHNVAEGCSPEFRVGEGDVIGAWDLMVSLMNEGEKAYIIATAAYCWGPQGLPPHIAPDQDLLFYIDLQEITHGPLNMNDMSETQRTHVATHKKARGNFLYKRGDTDGAIRTYIQALRIVSHGTELSPEADQDEEEELVKSADRSKEMITLHMAVLNNLSQAHLVTHSVDKARKICDEALDIDSNNIKALYRSGCVYMEMKEYTAAAQDLTRLLALDSGNTDAKHKLKVVNTRIQEENIAERKLYSAMMGKSDTAIKRKTAQKPNDTPNTDKSRGVHTRIATGTDTPDTKHTHSTPQHTHTTNGDTNKVDDKNSDDDGTSVETNGADTHESTSAGSDGGHKEGRRTPPKSTSPQTLVSSINEKVRKRKETRNVTFHETVSDNSAKAKERQANTRPKKPRRNQPESDSTLDWFMVVYSIVVVIFMALVIYNIYHMDKMHSSKLLDKYR